MVYLNKLVIIGPDLRSFANMRKSFLIDCREAGISIDVISGDGPKSMHKDIERIVSNLSVICFDSFSLQIKHFFFLTLELMKYDRKNKEKIWFIFSIKAIIFSIFSSIRKRDRTIILIAGLGVFKRPDSMIKKIVLWVIFNFYNNFIFQNHEDFRFCRRFFRKSCKSSMRSLVVNGSGVDLRSLKCLNQDKMKRPRRFVFASRFLKSKGIEIFLEAALLVASSGLKCKFLAIGRWEQHPDSCGSRYIHDVLSDDISVKPTDKPLVTEFKPGDILVLPSSYGEGVPKIALECLALGIPVIVNDFSGLREVVHHMENGLKLKVCNKENLAEAMIFALKGDYDYQEWARNSRRLAEEKFDSRQVNLKQIEFLNSI